MTDETKTAAREMFVKALCEEQDCMDCEGTGRAVTSWDASGIPTFATCPIGLQTVDAILASPALDAIVAERVAALADELATKYGRLACARDLRALAAAMTERTAEQ